MGQDASVGQSNLNALYLAIGKAVVGSTWPASGFSDAALTNIGAAAYAANPAIIQFPNDWTAPIPPTFVVANPGTGVEASNAEVPVKKNADGSVHGRIPGTSVIVNLPG